MSDNKTAVVTKLSMVGTRVYPSTKGVLPDTIHQPGAYGRHGLTDWLITCPDGTHTPLPKTHYVLEHEDGTISIQPVINLKSLPWEGWRGWLKRGVWIEARS